MTHWTRIRTNGLMITLLALVLSSGCSLLPTAQTPKPTKPTLTTVPAIQLVGLTQPQANNLVCFTGGDAQKLGAYILDLER